MSDATRQVGLERTGASRYVATNARGGQVPIGDGSDDTFTPVELLLAAIAGCSAIDVDMLTTRLSEPEGFAVSAQGEKVQDADGHHLTDLLVRFAVAFPEGADGDRARDRLPDAVAKSRDRLCTVLRTVALPSPVTFTVD